MGVVMAAMPSIIAGFNAACILALQLFSSSLRKFPNSRILWVAFSQVFSTIVSNQDDENQRDPAKLKSNIALMQY
jgi:ABC-type phosphate transport system permease subunit